MGRYAQGTTVSVEKSEIEVRRILARYGATKFGTMVEPERVPGTARTLGDELVPRLNALYSGASLRALLAGNPDE